MKFSFDGFLSHPLLKNKKITGYQLFDLKEEKFAPFITKFGEKNWQKIGPFFFIPRGLKKAEGIILRGKESELLIIDEVGPLELKEQGIWPSLNQVLRQLNKNILLVIRENIMEDFLKLVDKKKVRLFNSHHKDIFPEIIRTIKDNVIQ